VIVGTRAHYAFPGLPVLQTVRRDCYGYGYCRRAIEL